MISVIAAAGLRASANGSSERIVDERALDAVPFRVRKTMSRGAVLATAAMHQLVAALPAGALRDAGCFVGVGASGGSVSELHAMLRASLVDGAWSWDRFGGAGLAACNPLLAFQLMNNFTMAHAAIAAGVGTGVHGALFSRGAGTVHALAEAIAAVRDGDAAVAIAGGADSALHPVTRAELDRRHAWSGLPGEGAALLAVAPGPGLATLVDCRVIGADDRAAFELPAGPIVAIPDAALRARLADRDDVLDVSTALGECLAAGPALAWLRALDRIADGAPRVAVLTADVDGDLGVVVLERAP